MKVKLEIEDTDAINVYNTLKCFRDALKAEKELDEKQSDILEFLERMMVIIRISINSLPGTRLLDLQREGYVNLDEPENKDTET